MPGEHEALKTCDKCGAGIPREQLVDHTAARYKGKLLCPRCVQEVKARILAAKSAEQSAAAPDDPADVPIALVEEEEKPRVVAGTSTQIHGFSGTEMTTQLTERQYQRPLLKGTRAATRCKTFHCKLTDTSLQHLNEQVNEWVDEREGVEIKFALSNIGVVEGKHADPHLIVTIFY